MEYKLLWELGSSGLWSVHFIFCYGLFMLWPKEQAPDKKTFFAVPRRQGRTRGKNVGVAGHCKPHGVAGWKTSALRDRAPQQYLNHPGSPRGSSRNGRWSWFTQLVCALLPRGQLFLGPLPCVSQAQPWPPLCGHPQTQMTCLLLGLLLAVDVLIWREICTHLYLPVHPVLVCS